jgi:hypothetical protein
VSDLVAKDFQVFVVSSGEEPAVILPVVSVGPNGLRLEVPKQSRLPIRGHRSARSKFVRVGYGGGIPRSRINGSGWKGFGSFRKGFNWPDCFPGSIVFVFPGKLSGYIQV